MNKDIHFKIDYMSRKKLGKMKEKFAEYDVLLKCDENMNVSLLADFGLKVSYKVEAEGAHLCSGRVDSQNLDSICELDFVEKVEISKFLYLE